MIARDTGGGRSFAGAGLYYLHDRDAGTADRVAFTFTDNLHTDDPEKAMRVMAWTALHADELKAAAGVKATGRKLASPVHTFVFSWAPEERPEPAHMIETARSAMAALGLAEHEAVYVGHDDTDKRHVHVIVNRVNPQDGRAATLSKSRLKLSEWAEAYEREHGVHCHQRVANNERRRRGDRVIDLESRRRNAEQFSDWREKRKDQARSAEREKARFQDWVNRRRAEIDRRKQERLAQLERAQAVRARQAEERIARAYDTSAHRARLEAVEASLSVGGVKGLWRRLSGRRARDAALKEGIEKTIAAADQRRQEAERALKTKLTQERGQVLARQRDEAQALALRIEHARARREQEGWKSYKTDRPRADGRTPAPEQDNGRSFRSSWRERTNTPGRER